MSFKFGAKSRRNLKGVDETLVAVAERALEISPCDGTILVGGGLRTLAQAQANVRKGTGILNSLHRTGDAIDLVALTNGRVRWDNSEAFYAMAMAVKQAAAEMLVPIRQGCDWNMNGTFGESREWDWPHFENPVEYWMQKATDEMYRYRKELGLS